MSTMRGVFIGLSIWVGCLVLFFGVLGGMGLFGRSAVQSSVKRIVAEQTEKPEDGDPFADNDLEAALAEAQWEAEQSSGEFRRWAQQTPRSATRPTTPRGTPPSPMTDLRPY